MDFLGAGKKDGTTFLWLVFFVTAKFHNFGFRPFAIFILLKESFFLLSASLPLIHCLCQLHATARKQTCNCTIRAIARKCTIAHAVHVQLEPLALSPSKCAFLELSEMFLFGGEVF